LDKPVRPRKKVEPPSQPAGPLTVSSIEDTSFTINWNSPATDGGSPITNYLIEIRDVIKANWTEIATVSSSVNTFKVTSLIENNDYFVRVKAQNEANLTSHALETESFVTVKSPFTVPTAPTGFRVVSVGKDKVTLEFKDSESDGNLGIRNYLIEKRDSKRVTWVKACKVRPQTKSENNESHTYTVEIDDLVTGGSYYFRVLAENQKGLSESNEMKVVVHLEKELETPSKPLELNIVKQKRANAVMLEWKAPLYNGNESISEYVLEQWNSLTNEWHVFHRSGPLENTYFVGNLEDGLSYRFRVSASNSQGQSEPSMETYEFTCQDMSAPSCPAGPLKYTISEDQYVINLEWSKPKQDGGSKIKRYIVERRQIGLTDWTKIGFTSGAETSYKITEYSIEESAYSFRVYAENECGMKSSPLELSQPVRIERRKQVPEPASYVRIKEKTADSITLTWKSFSVDSFSGADRFIIEKREKNSTVWTKAGQSLSETFTLENLDSNSSYYFRVIAVNAAGEGQAAEYHELVSMDISNEVPSMPLSMSFDEIAQDNVTLSWISPTNSGLKPIIGYKIYKLESGSSVWQLCGQIHRAKQLSYTITDLDYKCDYRFKVCAYSEMGIGKPNETAKIQMKKPIEPPSEPVNLFVKSVANGEISITWMSPESTGGSPITEYHIERCEIISNLNTQRSDSGEDTDDYTVISRWIRHEVVDRYTLDYRFKNLNVGGLYSVRVAAYNAAGLGKYAEINEPVVARCLYSVPDAPTGPIILSNITRETVDASWHAPKYNGGSPLLSYFVEKRDVKEQIWIKVARIDADIRTLKIINVVEAHEYEIRVSAENEHGKSEPLVSEKIKPLRLYETHPSSVTPWVSLTNAKPYIDELYIVQELSREEYFFRIYAENLLSTVWESINFAELLKAFEGSN